MIRKVFSLLTVVLLGSVTAFGQSKVVEPCITTDVNQSMKEDFPQIEQYEEELRQHIQHAMSTLDMNRVAAKGTFGPDDTLHIPVVVHIIHDYASNNYRPDNDVFRLIDDINEVFLKQNADTVQVITPFKKYIGNPKIMFHLAQKDPKGNPTTGITRRQSYLTNGGDDQAKFDQWDPTSYLNIWIIQRIGRGISTGVIAAYATFPASAAAFPYTDGIITSSGSIFNDKTIPHEIGHCLNLFHTWGNIQFTTACTGDDEVDDTPPTTGHYASGQPWGASANGSCNNVSLYDTSCTNQVNTLAKILLDPALNVKVDNTTGKGLSYVPRTNLTVESVKIYPSKIGEEYTIVNQRKTGPNTWSQVATTPATMPGAIGKENIGSLTTTTKDTADALKRSGVEFTVSQDLMLDSFRIYPSTIGDTFRIVLLKFNNDTLRDYVGITNTTSGPQVIPFNAFIPTQTSPYRLHVIRNPGLRADSFRNSIPSYTKQIANAISIVNDSDVDTTFTSGAGTDPDYEGRYNYLYNWKVRYGSLTNTDSGAQYVTLNFPLVTVNDTFRVVVTKNPGLYNDTIGTAPYVRSVPCVLDIINDTAGNRYNLLYEMQIRYGYIVNCIDYPDTVNTQNIMDYSSCPRMFTELQVERMRAALSSSVGGRSNLVNDSTHVRTGILTGIGGTYGIRNDLKPVPEYSVEPGLNAQRSYFLCAGENFLLKERTWRDTVTSVTWTLSNGANIENSGNSTFTQPVSQVVATPTIGVRFSEPGWANVTLSATGNNTGDTSVTYNDALYVADPNFKVNPLNGFLMEFDNTPSDPGADLGKWPMFNYYKNNNKWELHSSAGFFGGTCIRYRGYDNRTGVDRFNGTPKGDVDDFFTPAFDLSGMTQTECRLSFMSAGAFRVADSRLYRDTLEISYSVNCGQSWIKLKDIMKAELANMGVVDVAFEPLWHGDWALQSIDIPVSARQDQVFFRFRFKPGVDDINASAGRVLPGTGNNFYIDRINISPWKLGVNTLLGNDKKIALAPNPTNKGTQIVININSRETAQVVVTDVTGKVVYTTQQQLNGSVSTIEIPESAVAVKGVYMVRVQAGTESFTEKLVSY